MAGTNILRESCGVARLLALLALLFGLLHGGATALAQNWPQRPVRFVLPLGAASGTDIGARLLADRLAPRWGQPVVIENRPGGDGIVAISAFVTARDDHVLLFSPSSSFTAHPYLHDNLPYKPSDLAPIARFSNTIISIAVPLTLQAGTLAELFDRARAQPAKLNWAGTTGATDFIFAGLIKRAGVNMTKVPYRNPVEAANDLGEGRVQAYASALAIVRPQLEAGKIRLLAVYNSMRAPSAPDIPTLAEAGFPELVMDGLIGLFGPPEMPPAQRERIALDVQAAADAAVGERLLATGQILNTGGPAEFGRAIDEQRAKIDAVAKELGMKPAQ
jgi:tripartite-type tricarboxylate transporter receptor subunit TctC